MGFLRIWAQSAALLLATTCRSGDAKVWKGSARLTPTRPWDPVTSFAFDRGAGEVSATLFQHGYKPPTTAVSVHTHVTEGLGPGVQLLCDKSRGSPRSPIVYCDGTLDDCFSSNSYFSLSTPLGSPRQARSRSTHQRLILRYSNLT